MSNPDFTTAVRVREAINHRFGQMLATTMDSGSLNLEIPEAFRERVVEMVEKIFVAQPEVQTISIQAGSQAEVSPTDLGNTMSTTGPHEGLIWAGLISQDERKVSDLEVLERIRAKLPKLKGVRFEAQDIGQAMMGGAQAAVEIKIFGKDVNAIIEKIKAVNDELRKEYNSEG